MYIYNLFQISFGDFLVLFFLHFNKKQYFCRRLEFYGKPMK